MEERPFWEEIADLLSDSIAVSVSVALVGALVLVVVLSFGFAWTLVEWLIAKV